MNKSFFSIIFIFVSVSALGMQTPTKKRIIPVQDLACYKIATHSHMFERYAAAPKFRNQNGQLHRILAPHVIAHIRNNLIICRVDFDSRFLDYHAPIQFNTASYQTKANFKTKKQKNKNKGKSKKKNKNKDKKITLKKALEQMRPKL